MELSQITKGAIMTKTQTIKKVSNIVMAVADLGAVIILSLVQGARMGVASKVIAVAIAFDLLVRLSVIAKPYFKE